MKIAISHGGQKGYIAYDEDNKDVLVSHPNPAVRDVVTKHLTRHRPYKVANGDQVGAFGLKHMSGTDSEDAMYMSLSELHFNTGVHVHWDDTGKTSRDPNGKADKPILKSIEGDIGYDIIN